MKNIEIVEELLEETKDAAVQELKDSLHTTPFNSIDGNKGHAARNTAQEDGRASIKSRVEQAPQSLEDTKNPLKENTSEKPASGKKPVASKWDNEEKVEAFLKKLNLQKKEYENFQALLEQISEENKQRKNEGKQVMYFGEEYPDNENWRKILYAFLFGADKEKLEERERRRLLLEVRKIIDDFQKNDRLERKIDIPRKLTFFDYLKMPFGYKPVTQVRNPETEPVAATKEDLSFKGKALIAALGGVSGAISGTATMVGLKNFHGNKKNETDTPK